MYDIRHLDGPFHFPEMMLVMPKAVRTAALLVYEVMPLDDMGDLRHPIDPKAGYGR